MHARITLSSVNKITATSSFDAYLFIMFRFRRDIGTFGVATLNWQITRHAPNSPDPLSTFNVSSGTVTFQNGYSSQSLAVMVSALTITMHLLLK